MSDSPQGFRGHSAFSSYSVSIVRSLVCNCQLQSGATSAEVVEALHTTNSSKTPLDCSYLIAAHQEQCPLSDSQIDSEIGGTNLSSNGPTQKRGLRVVGRSALWLARRQLRVFTSQRSVSVFLINPQPQGGQAIKSPIEDAYSSGGRIHEV